MIDKIVILEREKRWLLSQCPVCQSSRKQFNYFLGLCV